MKIPDATTIFHTPARPIPYTDEEQNELIRFIWGLPVELSLSPAQRQLLDVWLQQLLYSEHPFTLPQSFNVGQLTEALIERFGQHPSKPNLTDEWTTARLERLFAASPTINFRQLQLTLEHNEKGVLTLKVDHHPVEWDRLARFAWRMAGLTLLEEFHNEPAQQLAA